MDGPDGILGTGNEDLQLSSPCIDAVRNGPIALDARDLNGNGHTLEPVPFAPGRAVAFRGAAERARYRSRRNGSG